MGHVKMVEENPMGAGLSKQPNEGDKKFQRLEGVINQLIKEIKKQNKHQSQRRSQQSLGGRSPPRTKDARCYSCGEIGHFAKARLQKARERR